MSFRPKYFVSIAILLALIALPASADKIFVDYDSSVDFSKFETFTYAPAKKGVLAQNEITDQRIVDDIVKQMIAGGLQQVEEGAELSADLVVTYQLTKQTGTRFDITGMTPAGSLWGSGWGWGGGYGAGWGYAGSGWYSATTMTSNYTVGTLIIAAYDTSNKQGVWRGSAEIKPGKYPTKTHKKIDKSIETMAEKWHHMHAKESGQ